MCPQLYYMYMNIIWNKRNIRNEPAHDKTYNKTCVTSRLRSACTSTQYGKGSRLPLFG